MIKDNTHIRDNVTITVFNLEELACDLGITVKEVEERILAGEDIPGEIQTTHNIITQTGLDVIAYRMRNDNPETEQAYPAIRRFGVGYGNSAPAITQIALDNEVFNDQITQWIIGGIGVQTAKSYLSSQYANGYTLREAGLFAQHVAGGQRWMVARALITPTITKTTSIGVTLSWTITIT